MDLNGLYQVIVLALATAAISVTTSKSRLFASAREWSAKKNTWLGELVSCSYCTSHWVAITLVVIYQPVVVSQWVVIDLFVSVFVIVAIAAIVSGVVIKLTPFRSVNDTPHDVHSNGAINNVREESSLSSVSNSSIR